MWYYVSGGEQQGPVSEEELQSLVRSGVVSADSLVWQKGMPQWRRYADVASQGAEVGQGRDPAMQGVSQVCAECGAVFPADEMGRYGDSYVCATCGPLLSQRVKEGAPLRGAMQYGGFWIRGGAKIIDWLILGVANGAIQFGFAGSMALEPGQPPSREFLGLWALMALLQIAVSAAYTTFFLGKFAATPGKMALRLKVVTSGGERISYLQAFGRFFAEMLSGIILYIGYILAAFDKEKRTLHDRICDTRVIRK